MIKDEYFSKETVFNTIEYCYRSCRRGSKTDFHDLIIECLNTLPPSRIKLADPDKGKVLEASGKTEMFDGEIITHVVCPSCGRWLTSVKFSFKHEATGYCEHCGQKVHKGVTP